MASLTHADRRNIVFLAVYWIAVPAAIITLAVLATLNLSKERSQDKALHTHLNVLARDATENCQRAIALLNYFILSNDAARRAGSPYAPVIRPFINNLILEFDRIGDCPIKP